MNIPAHFRAPWSRKVKLMTAVVVIIIGGTYVISPLWASLPVVGVLLGCFVFMIRGYSVTEDEILIHRLGWATRFDLQALHDVYAGPGSTVGSVRTFGVGGLFGYLGWFRNATLGSYRAYATNEANTVVLEFDGKTVVVTPDAPADFVEAVHRQRSEPE